MIRKKILELMREVDYLQKDKTNDFHKYKYVSDEAVMEKLHPLLVKHGILAVPHFATHEGEPGMERLSLELMIYDVDEPEEAAIVVSTVGTGKDQGDKGAAKAMTMAYKYAWLKLLALATGDDPEGDPETDRLAATPPVTRSGLTPVGTAAQNALSGAGIAPPRQNPQEQPPGTFVVSGVKIDRTGIFKKGKNKDKPYTIWAVLTEDGSKFVTFDDVMADRASSFKGQQVTIVSEQNQYGGHDLKRIDPVVPF